MPTDTTYSRTPTMHRRGHRKSRNGCVECKRRHIKVRPFSSWLSQFEYWANHSPGLVERSHHDPPPYDRVPCVLTPGSLYSAMKLIQHVYNAAQRSFAVCMRLEEHLVPHSLQRRLERHREMAHHWTLPPHLCLPATSTLEYRNQLSQMPISR
jgi:hypothetical protein